MKNEELIKAAFTPGPWSWKEVTELNGLGTKNTQYLVGKGKNLICEIDNKSGISHTDRLERAEANARLIAAAPDMLEALQGIEQYAIDQIADYGASYQEGGSVMTEEAKEAIGKWTKVISAISKALSK